MAAIIDMPRQIVPTLILGGERIDFSELFFTNDLATQRHELRAI